MPGARETFTAVLGEDEKKVPAKKAALVAPPSKLKPPPPIKATALPPKEEKIPEKNLEPLPEAAKLPVTPLPSKPEVELALPPPPPLAPVVPEEVVSVPAGQAENLSLEFSLEEACRAMEKMAETAVGAGKSYWLILP